MKFYSQKRYHHYLIIYLFVLVNYCMTKDLGRFTPRTFHPRKIHPPESLPQEHVHPPDCSPPGMFTSRIFHPRNVKKIMYKNYAYKIKIMYKTHQISG